MPNLLSTYRIAGNFRGRKLSRIGEKYAFRGENFCGLLAFAVPKDATPQILQRKLSRIAQNREICKSFLPRKFSAIWYVTCGKTNSLTQPLFLDVLIMYSYTPCIARFHQCTGFLTPWRLSGGCSWSGAQAGTLVERQEV